MGALVNRLSEGTFICEDVSRLEYKGGMFYLTDDLGNGVSITRAMRPETFIRCVTGAYQLAMAWQSEQRALKAVDELDGKVVPFRH